MSARESLVQQQVELVRRQKSLGQQQTELVQALVVGGAVPAGFDVARVRAATVALLHKRRSEVARHWPGLLREAAVRAQFVAWADGRVRAGSFADGLAFAEHLEVTGGLSAAGMEELRLARLSRRARRGRSHWRSWGRRVA